MPPRVVQVHGPQDSRPRAPCSGAARENDIILPPHGEVSALRRLSPACRLLPSLSRPLVTSAPRTWPVRGTRIERRFPHQRHRRPAPLTEPLTSPCVAMRRRDEPGLGVLVQLEADPTSAVARSSLFTRQLQPPSPFRHSCRSSCRFLARI